VEGRLISGRGAGFVVGRWKLEPPPAFGRSTDGRLGAGRVLGFDGDGRLSAGRLIEGRLGAGRVDGLLAEGRLGAGRLDGLLAEGRLGAGRLTEGRDDDDGLEKL